MSRQSRRTRSVQIKICGITNPTDALDSIELGADALGFNLYPASRRFVDIQSASEWISKLPGTIGKVAVLVNPTIEQAVSVAQLPFIDSLQLHGNESPEFCAGLAQRGISFTKALPMRDETSLRQPTSFSTNSILLDSGTASGFGGSGQTFPWSLARRFVEVHPDFRVILAGGLTAENVAEAIEIVGPAGIDVTSGVEATFGRKDRGRLHAFISAARPA
jgi:phosphoribosylanthranilate isomerase